MFEGLQYSFFTRARRELMMIEMIQVGEYTKEALSSSKRIFVIRVCDYDPASIVVVVVTRRKKMMIVVVVVVVMMIVFCRLFSVAY